MSRTNEPIRSEADSLPIARKRYQAPVLIRFGTVSTLTQSGSVTGTENKGSSKTKKPSDRLVKHNINHIGQHPLGFGLYLFDYKPEFVELPRGRQFGVIAQEVEAVVPQAVSTVMAGGITCKQVDYSRLGIQLPLH